MATAFLSRATLCDAPRGNEEVPNVEQKNLLQEARREAATLFKCFEHGHSLESLRATIGVSAQEESELLAFAEAFPEERSYIDRVIELRRLTLREFDEFVRLHPLAVSVPEVQAEQSVVLQPAEAKPRPTEIAQRLLDTLDGLDVETVRKALYFTAKCRGVLADGKTQSVSVAL
jgi:hypothetical protein